MPAENIRIADLVAALGHVIGWATDVGTALRYLDHAGPQLAAIEQVIAQAREVQLALSGLDQEILVPVPPEELITPVVGPLPAPIPLPRLYVGCDPVPPKPFDPGRPV